MKSSLFFFLSFVFFLLYCIFSFYFFLELNYGRLRVFSHFFLFVCIWVCLYMWGFLVLISFEKLMLLMFIISSKFLSLNLSLLGTKITCIAFLKLSNNSLIFCYLKIFFLLLTFDLSDFY